jgi:hypothetical protein
MRVEDLGPTLYVRASWKDPWLNLVNREAWPVGAGLVRSAFTVGRSEPATDEETWSAIAVSNGESYTGSCSTTYNQTYVGYKENTYKPSGFGLVGPLICQDDLTLHWNSADFWEKYFQALEKRNVKSIVNRLANVYMQYVPKAVAGSSFSYIDGDFTTQPVSSTVDMTGLDCPECGLIQDYLDATALELMEEGATDPNSNGWITMGENGPIFPLMIGVEASNTLLRQNAELRQDYRTAYEGLADANPVIKRLGATLVIKNFRHMITLFPPRWSCADGVYTRIPTWVMSTDAGDASKGRVAIVNPDWRDPAVANVEGAIVWNPWVMTEEVLMPVNSLPGANLKPQNYFGEWKFVTGNDALIGFDGCTGIADPTHKQGRHFAEYRAAWKPVFPSYGRLILFSRCSASYDCVSCS